MKKFNTFASAKNLGVLVDLPSYRDKGTLTTADKADIYGFVVRNGDAARARSSLKVTGGKARISLFVTDPGSPGGARALPTVFAPRTVKAGPAASGEIPLTKEQTSQIPAGPGTTFYLRIERVGSGTVKYNFNFKRI